MADLLVECPFCDTQHERADFSIVRTQRLPSGGLVRVMCTCGAMSPASETVEGAFTQWNYRPKLMVEKFTAHNK